MPTEKDINMTDATYVATLTLAPTLNVIVAAQNKRQHMISRENWEYVLNAEIQSLAKKCFVLPVR